MELTMKNGFCEMNEMEMQEVDGGIVLAVVAIGTATYTITGSTVVGAVVTAWGVGKTCYEIYNAFAPKEEV